MWCWSPGIRAAAFAGSFYNTKSLFILCLSPAAFEQQLLVWWVKKIKNRSALDDFCLAIAQLKFYMPLMAISKCYTLKKMVWWIYKIWMKYFILLLLTPNKACLTWHIVSINAPWNMHLQATWCPTPVHAFDEEAISLCNILVLWCHSFNMANY